MDPLSITTSVAALVSTGIKSLQVYKQFHSLYTSADLTVVSLRTQCSCIDFALLEIQDLLVEDPRTTDRLTSEGRLGKNFDFVLGACHLTFSLLNEQLGTLVVVAQNEYGQMRTRDKLKSMWNSQEMKDLRNNVQGQAMAVNLLLTTLQAKSKAEGNRILLKRSSKDILKTVADNASSIGVSQTAKGEDDFEEKEKMTINSDITDTEFDFDNETINTPAYRRAFAAARRQAMSANQLNWEPSNFDGSNPSERRNLISVYSERVGDQSNKHAINQNASSDIVTADVSSEVVGLSTGYSEAKASLSSRAEFTLNPVYSLREREERNKRELQVAKRHTHETLDLQGSKNGEAPTEPTSLCTFPDTSERWETLSSHWEELTSCWIQRLMENQTEGEDVPPSQQVARRISDLSAAGSNLFSAVVELQRLRASSERNVQQWFSEFRVEQENALEVRSRLEKALQEEQEKLTIAQTERTAAFQIVQEMRRELDMTRTELDVPGIS